MMFSRSKGDTPITPTSQAKGDKKNERRATSAPSIIGSDVQLVGNLTTIGEVQLDGIVEGDVNCGSLVLGEHGKVTGTIVADTVTVRGRVEGSIRARLVRLEKSAKIKGDVYHETLSVEAGATIEGTFTHEEATSRDKPAAQAYPKPESNVRESKPQTGQTAACQDSSDQDKVSKTIPMGSSTNNG